MGIIKKGLQIYKKYGVRGAIASFMQKGQIKDKDYAIWYEKHKPTREILEKQKKEQFSYDPIISIVVPVYNTPVKFLEDMIESVRVQSYSKWELCIANANPDNAKVKNVLKKHMQQDQRIKEIEVPENLGIAQNTNAAISLARGEYIGLLDHDDMLSPDALYEVIKCLNEEKRPEVIYTDEDKITMDGKKHFQPNFKPEFNLDMLRSNNYICHFFVVKRTLLDEVGGFHKEYNGAQDHDLIFRCTEKANGIVRIPKILYHWRTHQGSTSENPESKRYAYLAGIKAVEAHLERCGEEGTAELTETPGFYKVRYKLREKPLVSIVVVNSEVKKISNSVLMKLIKDYGEDKVEVCFVDSSYRSKRYEELEERGIKIQYLLDRNNNTPGKRLAWGIRKSNGLYLLLLSPYIMNVGKHYIEELISNSMRKCVGIVGGKLYYPNRTIKNTGIVLGKEGKIEYLFEHLPKACRGYMNRPSMQQNLNIVTLEGAMIKKCVWENCCQKNSSDSFLDTAIKWCSNIRNAQYLIVFDPYAEAISCKKNERRNIVKNNQ